MARPLKPRRRVPPPRRLPGSVRIIGGVWRGRRLPVPHHPDLRPTPDRVRETVFNWLQPWLPGARCLDLFAGTGVLGLEALSRGASAVTLVEHDADIFAALQQNLERLETHAAHAYHAEAFEYLRGQGQAFDILFLDPPFRSQLLPACIALLIDKQWIKPGGLVYIESAKAGPGWTLPPSWALLRSKSAGQVDYHLARTSL